MIDWFNTLGLAQQVCIITGVVWLVIDVYLAAAKKETISNALRAWASRSKWGLLLPFLSGVVMGHLWW